MKDKRLTLRFTEYWNGLRRGDSLPLWKDFDPSAFSDIWQQCCDWKIESGEGASVLFTYDYMGDLLKQAIGSDLAGQKFKGHLRTAQGLLPLKKEEGAKPIDDMFSGDFKGFPAASVIKKVDKVVHKKTPVIDEGRFVNSDGKTIRYRSCLLPFGDEANKIVRIVLGLSWKNY